MTVRHGGCLETAMSSWNKAAPVDQRIHEGEYVRDGIEHAKPEPAHMAGGFVRRREEAKNICPELVSVALFGIDLDRLREDEMHRSPELF